MPLHATAVYVGLFGVLFLGLANRVVYLRRTLRVGIGHGEHKNLRRAIRVHANFCEYAPLALLVLAAIELNGASETAVHCLGGTMVLGRVLHAFGLSRHHGTSLGRFWGLAAAWLALGVGSAWAIWLGLS